MTPFTIYQNNSPHAADWITAADSLGIDKSNATIDQLKEKVSSLIKKVIDDAKANCHTLAHNVPDALRSDPAFARHVILLTQPASVHYFTALSKDADFQQMMLRHYQLPLDQRLFRRACGRPDAMDTSTM